MTEINEKQMKILRSESAIKLHVVESKISEELWVKLKKKADSEYRTVAGEIAWLISEATKA